MESHLRQEMDKFREYLIRDLNERVPVVKFSYRISNYYLIKDIRLDDISLVIDQPEIKEYRKCFTDKYHPITFDLKWKPRVFLDDQELFTHNFEIILYITCPVEEEPKKKCVII